MELYNVSDGTGTVITDDEIGIRETYTNIKLTVCDVQEAIKQNHSKELRDETKNQLGCIKRHRIIIRDSLGNTLYSRTY